MHCDRKILLIVFLVFILLPVSSAGSKPNPAMTLLLLSDEDVKYSPVITPLPQSIYSHASGIVISILFQAHDPNNDTITAYRFCQPLPIGTIYLNGAINHTTQPGCVVVTAEDMLKLSYASINPGIETIQVWASDGEQWSSPGITTVNVLPDPILGTWHMSGTEWGTGTVPGYPPSSLSMSASYDITFNANGTVYADFAAGTWTKNNVTHSYDIDIRQYLITSTQDELAQQGYGGKLTITSYTTTSSIQSGSLSLSGHLAGTYYVTSPPYAGITIYLDIHASYSGSKISGKNLKAVKTKPMSLNDILIQAIESSKK